VTPTELPSPNCDDRPGGAASVDMLILHYTGMQSAREAIDRLRDPAAKVSSHYVVDEDGMVFRLVPEHLRAYHAGLSYWRGRRALNDVSVGIEIVNPGHEWGYRPFPAAQMAAVETLCLEILSRHAIPAAHVVGHSDVAPTRKQDPGELFPWQALAAAGIGLWPDADEPTPPALDAARASLAAIGYEVPADEALATSLRAFQRHWLPHQVTGEADRATLARVRAVEKKARGSAPGPR
jgi:N-acetylmuramoyl-L-alanine amidase